MSDTIAPGTVFGWLTVLRRFGAVKGHALYCCRCACGEEVIVKATKLREGRRKSCGINSRVVTSPCCRYFGSKRLGHEREYQSWRSMLYRCRHPERVSEKDWACYGGRGITVCERWGSFANFLEDMGPKPTPEHTIERRNNDGNYEPNNCRWATKSEQRYNTRRSVYVIYEGERVGLAELVAKLGVDQQLVGSRIRAGWSVSDAISVRKRRKACKKRRLTQPP